MKLNARILGLMFPLVVSTAAQARWSCDQILLSQSKEVQALAQEDAYIQWRVWEQTANFAPFVKTTEAFQIPVAVIAKDQLKIVIDKEAPENFIHYVEGQPGGIAWFKHPFNTSKVVPYLDSAPVTSVEAFYTASRSVVLGGEFRGLTLKMGTDRPHGPTGEYQPSKANTADDVKSAMIHSEHLKKVELEYGVDSEFLMLPEVMTVAESKTSVGYVVRDVRAMDSGHYYLPALSIPYVGREIAKLNDVKFEDFWQKNYAELLGRAKAKMLLRYGLQMETPNSQNMLIQFNRQMQPTGRIFFRDISDSFFVDVVAKGLGFDKQLERDIQATYSPHQKIQPYWSNSSWRFDQAGEKSIKDDTLHAWGNVHDNAYISYVNKELGLSIPEVKNTTDSLGMVYKTLGTAEGQKALKEYREKMVATKSQASN